MRFTKMQGLGNDYVYVNCFEERVETPELAAKKLSDRHFGVGADGLILIGPSKKADCRMKMYNADGSRGTMCGNGIRCVAKYVYEAGLVGQTEITVETDSGIRLVNCCQIEDGKVRLVEVDMGIPSVEKQERFQWEERELFFVPVDMGNPHAVFFDAEAEHLDLLRFGPVMERHPYFPDRTNVELVQIQRENLIRLRVWERGSGETLACGTGACAAFAAARTMNFVGERATVELPGGTLEIAWQGPGKPLFMTGPAEEVFCGEII
ncbi:MAG: diaminopimelate epimerase [Lachnospiraceae bacterium]|nr:diaminopimelate epimerase [Lachnospiraceae bacterium]